MGSQLPGSPAEAAIDRVPPACAAGVAIAPIAPIAPIASKDTASAFLNRDMEGSLNERCVQAGFEGLTRCVSNSATTPTAMTSSEICTAFLLAA